MGMVVIGALLRFLPTFAVIAAPHLALLVLLVSCCGRGNGTRTRSTARKPSESGGGPHTPVSAETPATDTMQSPAPTGATAAGGKPLAPSTGPATSNTPSTNPSSQQPASGSPQNSAKRKQRAAAAACTVLPKQPPSSEQQDASQTGKKMKDSPNKKGPDEEMARPSRKPSPKRPAKSDSAPRRKKSDKAEELRKQEQKTQEAADKTGGDQVEVEPTAATRTAGSAEARKKKPGFFSREHFRRTLGMKPADPAPAKLVQKRPNWTDQVPESQLPDDLTDFDGPTKHTQDDKTGCDFAVEDKDK